MELIEAPQAIHLDPNVVGNHKFGSSSATRKETRTGVAKDPRVETLDTLCMHAFVISEFFFAYSLSPNERSSLP